jgi:hypothetical protein
MKTYRLENWDMLRCPNTDNSHVGGQIYGHPDYKDGTWVMSSHVLWQDNEKHLVQTHCTGLLQLGEMSDKMKQKQIEAAKDPEVLAMKDANGQPPTVMLRDTFQGYKPEEWGIHGQHEGVEDASDALNSLLKNIFGRPGKPDTKH